jgi:hypothetical protein
MLGFGEEQPAFDQEPGGHRQGCQYRCGDAGGPERPLGWLGEEEAL